MLHQKLHKKIVLSLDEHNKLASFVQILMTIDQLAQPNKAIKKKRGKTKPKYEQEIRLARNTSLTINLRCKKRANITFWAYA